MRVGIIGGTGFTGDYFVRAMLAAGHELSLLVRPGSEYRVQQQESCKRTSGNLASRNAVGITIKDCDAVLFNVGILREIKREGVTFEALQLDAASLTIDLMKELGVKRLLLMSANGVKVPGTPYQETKRRAEQYALASGLDVTVFRPSVIFGDPRGKMEFATQLYRDMVAPPLPAISFFNGFSPSRGAVVMSPVHVEDVADAFVSALANEETIGQTYVLGGPEVLAWPEMLKRIARATGRRKLIIPMPILAMRLAATFFDWLPAFPVTRHQLTMLAEGNAADPAELESLIGRRPAAFDTDALGYLDR